MVKSIGTFTSLPPVELIVILYKDQWKKISGSGQSDMNKEEFMEWTNGLWTFPGESKKRIGHPAPFPIELPRRCIKLFSYVGGHSPGPVYGKWDYISRCMLKQTLWCRN